MTSARAVAERRWGMAYTTMTWATAVAAWLVMLRAAGHPETTIRTKRQHVEQAAHELRGDPWSVTPERLVTYMAGHEWMPETRHAHRTSLRGFYAWGVRAGLCEASPADELPPVRRTPPRPRPLPEGLFRAALADAGPKVRLMVLLAGDNGLRRAEIAVVHTLDVLGDPGVYSLVVHGKGGKERVVPIADTLARVILAARGYLFPGQIGGHVSAAHVGKLVSGLLPDRWTTHTLRHRFATRAYAIDHDLFTVQELLGHASADTTRRYVLVPDDAKRRLVAAVAA